MSMALDDFPRDPDQLLCHLQQTAEVIARQNASLVSLQAQHDTVLVERDAAQAEIERLDGVEPQAWLTDVLERMVSGRTKAHELARLLPWSWQAGRLATAVQA